MHAILITTSPWRPSAADQPNDLPSLRLLIDRPFLQHVVEYLVAAGITTFDVVMCQTPEAIRNLLQDGSRWGVTISYHTVKNPTQPYRLLPNQTTPVLLAHTDRLGTAAIQHDDPASSDTTGMIYTCPDGWSGWAWLTPQICRRLSPTTTIDELQAQLPTAAPTSEIPLLLASDTWPQIIQAQRQIIDQHIKGLMLTGTCVEPGIWLSRNVKMHPTVRIVAPVYIGPDCDIGKRVTLGPNAVIGRKCVIDDHSTISDSLVYPDTYVGQALELDHAVANRNKLINTRIGSSVTITDSFILGSIARESSRWQLTSLLESALAGLLLLPLLPVLLTVCLMRWITGKKPVFHSVATVRLPTVDDRAVWRTAKLFGLRAFQATTDPDSATDCMLLSSNHPGEWLRVGLPILINVFLGRCHFVGLPPRTCEQVEALPEQWRAHYLKSKCGAITETLVNYGSQANQDERFATEAVYAVSAGLAYDAKLLGRYFQNWLKR